MNRSAHVLILIVLCSGVAACTMNREPTYGDRIQDEASALRSVGEDWSRGEALVERGEKRIKDGQEKIRDGERLIEQGRGMTREGTALMRDSQRRYEQRDGPTAP